MRHLSGLTPIEVLLLATGMIRAARFRLLVTAPSFPHRLAPTRLRALAPAMALAAVAVEAEEEHLAAPAAYDEAQRVHGFERDR